MSLKQLAPPSTPAIKGHYKRTRGHHKSTSLVRQRTQNIFINSFRGFDTGAVPVKPQKQPLKRRRYSIEVITTGWDKKKPTQLIEKNDSEILDPATDQILANEMENNPQPAPTLSLPDPNRFSELVRWRHTKDMEPEDMFLELPGSSLTYEDFNLIKGTGRENWFRDPILDVALELLARDKGCKESGIAIAPSMVSMILSRAGRYGDVDDNNYAQYKEEKARFQDSKWIFLPVNDGMLAEEATHWIGAHWSLLIINRKRRTAHYIDSLFLKSKQFQELAGHIAEGVGNILGEEYDLLIEENSPDQNRDNKYKGHDTGPCGPFVYKMSDVLIEYIQLYSEPGDEDNCDISLPYGFGQCEDWDFNSVVTRKYIANVIGEARAQQVAKKCAEEHDRQALEGLGS